MPKPKFKIGDKLNLATYKQKQTEKLFTGMVKNGEKHRGIFIVEIVKIGVEQDYIFKELGTTCNIFYEIELKNGRRLTVTEEDLEDKLDGGLVNRISAFFMKWRKCK